MADNLEKNLASATEKIRATLPKTEETQTSNGGTATATQQPKVDENTDAPKVETPASELLKVEGTQESDLQAFLKKNNISSITELEERIVPKRQKSEDEQKAELIDWAVKNENMKVDDFLSAEEIQKKKDADVVFDNFAAKLQSKNKNISQQEIQSKWDKKYGEVIETAEIDAEGNAKTKVVYDDDEISEQAKQIREQRLQPINNAKSKFINVQKEQEISQRINREFTELSKTIPDKVKIKIDDKNTLEYDLEPKYRETLIPKLQEQYTFFRKNAPNEQLDVDNFMNHVSNVVMQDNFGNIANIYRQKGVDSERLENAKKLENPIVTPLNLNTGGQPTVDMKAEAKKLRQNLPKP